MRRGWIDKTLPGGDAPGEVEPGVVGDYPIEEEDTGSGGGWPPDMEWAAPRFWRSRGRIRVRGRSTRRLVLGGLLQTKTLLHSKGRIDPIIGRRGGKMTVTRHRQVSTVVLHRRDQTAAILALMN